MAATGSTEERPTVQDEDQSNLVQNTKDVHPKEFSSISNEKTSTKKTRKLMGIPLESVLIPVYVFRPETKQGNNKPKNEFCSSLQNIL